MACKRVYTAFPPWTACFARSSRSVILSFFPSSSTLLCHFLLSVQQADGTNAAILPISSCFVVVHFCDILFSSVITPQIPEICVSLLLLFIPCLFVMLFPPVTFLFSFSGFFFFLLQSLQTGLAGILILCVFFGQSSTKSFCFPTSVFTPHRGCRPLS